MQSIRFISNISKRFLKASLLLSFCLFPYFSSVFAQTEPMYSQYMYNMLGVNPAYAGNRQALGINLFQRRQWVGLEGAPQTTSVSLDQAFKNNKSGWGLQVYNDKLGVERATGSNIMLATKVQISEKGTLSGGLSFGLMNYRIDLMNVTGRFTPNDPAFYTNLNKWLPTMGMGLYYNTDNFYVGVSVPNVLKSKLSAIDIIKSGIQKVNNYHLFITSGYVFTINDNLKLKPSSMVKLVSGAPVQVDMNLNVWMKDILGIGASYRTGDAFVTMAEVQASENLKLGYAYDIPFSTLSYFKTGSHEFMVRYEFGNGKTKVKSTRYF